MEESLKKSLTKYRDSTLEIIDILEKDSFDSIEELEGLIQKRQHLADELMSFKWVNDEDKKEYKDLQLEELENRVDYLISQKLQDIKKKIDIISKKKDANKVYNGNIYNGARIFSVKK